MKILFDNQIFSLQQRGGISRYFTELIYGLKNTNNINVYFKIFYTNNKHIIDKQLSIYNKYLDKIEFRGKYRIIEFLKKKNEKYIKLQLQGLKYDIFHPTYYNPYFLEFIGHKPFVLTVHDMIHEIFPQYFKPTDKTIKNKELLIKKAAKIIAVSKNTKNDILKFYPEISSDKIKVIYHGNNIIPISNPFNPSIKLPNKYLLFVGERGDYKNFDFFIKSVSSIINKNNDLYIICAGGGKFSDLEKNLLSELGVENKVKYLEVDDNLLANLYRNASIFVYPSKYEGFGFPIIEAFTFKCPVLLSNSSCFPEIGGEGAMYFDINNSNSLHNMTEELLNSIKLRQELTLKGTKELKKYSIEQTIKQTAELYMSLDLKN